MLNKPKIKPCYRLDLEPEGIFLQSERASVILSDYLEQLLTSLIKEGHSAEEIVEKILPQLLPENPSIEDAINAGFSAFSKLAQMEHQGYITESSEQLPLPLAIFCNHLNIDIEKAYHRLQNTKVSVTSLGSISTTELIDILESMEVKIAEEGDIKVILTDDYLQKDLEFLNQELLEKNFPWMLVKPVGTVLWIGPIFQPEKTGCWECLAQRLRNNRPIAGFIQRRKRISTSLTPPLSTLPSTWQTALGMTATEIFKWIVQGENKRLEGSLITYDTLSLETHNHILVKRPQCPNCGEKEFQLKARKPLPIILGNRKKIFITDGGHRCCLPQETWQKYQHHISPITGVVRALEKVSSTWNNLTHTYVAKHHFATAFDDLTSLRQNITGRSAGKGRTEEQARASAFGEAIERYSSIFQGDEIRQQCSYQQLGEQAIHPNNCMNFSQEQYRTRQEWNANCSSLFQKIPEPFNEEREIEWTPVWSLTYEDFKYLPTAYCYHGYPQLSQADCWSDTNGCAAGNTMEEAILQGFMELVERDSVALWWYNRLKKPRVDLDSFDEPYFQALKDYYRSLHRDLWVLDITSDLNIPAFAAITRRTDREVEDIVLGYGSHFDAKIAIGRALTEVNQILPAVLLANEDGTIQYLSYDPLAIEWWKTATLANQPYLIPESSVPPKVSADYPQLWSDDLLEDILTCKQIVENNGMEMLILDQTRLDIGLKVAKVIVPGMRHFWKRLDSGRLYDVPVKMRWLQEPLKENQLNPFPMWM